MLTIKNRASWEKRLARCALWLPIALLFSACTPAGPKNLLEGRKLIERGKYAQAIERLTNAVSIMGTNAQAWNYLGLAYHYAGRPADAEMAYQRALRLDQDLSEARYNLGCLWLEQNKPDLARTELTAFTLRRGNSLDGFLKLGEAQFASRDAAAIAASEKSFQEALRLNQQNVEALNGLGMVRYYQRRFGDAQQLFVNALRQRADFAPAILNLGILLQTRFQDYHGAAQRYRQYAASRPRPENADAVLALAREVEERAKPAPSVANVRTQAVAESPVAKINAVTNSARTNKETNVQTHAVAPPPPQTNLLRQTNAATNISTPVARANPETTNAGLPSKQLSKPVPANRLEAERLFAQGSEAQKAHRLPDAIAAYRAATQLDPSYFEAHYNLGLAAAEAGNVPTALAAYEKALALVPDSPDARYNLGLLLKQAGQATDAANELERLLAKYPNDARGHLALANLYAQQLHDDNRAREHYLKVLEIDPHNAQADEIRHWVSEHPQ